MEQKESPKLTKEEIDQLQENLSNRILYIETTLGITQKELAKETGISTATLNRWSNDRQKSPGAHALYQFTKHVNRLLDTHITLDWLFSKETVGNFKHLVAKTAKPEGDEETYNHLRKSVMESCESSLWIQVRIGTDLNTTTVFLEDVFTRLEEVKVLLPNPNHNELMDELKEFRSDPSDRNREITQQDIRRTTRKVISTAKAAGITEKLEIRYLNYLPSCIAYIADPHLDTGLVFTALSSFQQPYHSAPLTVVPRAVDMLRFEFYVREFNNMWESELSTIEYPVNASLSPTSYK